MLAEHQGPAEWVSARPGGLDADFTSSTIKLFEVDTSCGCSCGVCLALRCRQARNGRQFLVIGSSNVPCDDKL
jgi:hypothetical protein